MGVVGTRDCRDTNFAAWPMGGGIDDSTAGDRCPCMVTALASWCDESFMLGLPCVSLPLFSSTR